MAVPSFLARERIIARPGFNRWLIPPAALAVHLCIGQAYATSVYKAALVSHFDSTLTAIGIIFSIAIVMLGLSAAVFGTWVDRNGPRAAMFTAACFWSVGFLVGALGISTEQLWLVYLGYGVIGGIGLGIGYISPVSTLIKWFPDRPGLATGMAIMGFGGGALIASPLSRQLMNWYDPSYDGTAGTTPSGASVAGLFVTLGLVYLVFMMFGAFIVRVPADDWRPAGFDPSTVKQRAMVTTESVSAGNAIKTPQFWLLWTVLFCNVTAGIGILEQAAPMIQDFFRNGETSAVAAAAAGGFVGLLSLFNMAGRFVWSSTSDYIGRKGIYMVYLGVGLVLYVLLATIGSSAVWLFVALAAIIISFYGGGFATVPAYLRDLFGTYQVGAIHGRLLTAWAAAGIAGPLIVNGVLDAQGTPGQLVAADYRPALFIMVGLLAVGFVANLLVKPVAAKWHEPHATTPATARANPERSTTR
ncbi:MULTISPECIES: OFA family MFS transporter [unclassified Modestobacter]|uniref:OFA family MFS transporter n=1 Tax=unclassified Modestobacter TaxID=2643866 RepID=UPI0022AA43DC|nr:MULTISPECIES: OFA family MFS transporter [unclassified Modestobacter]MCZ2811353.1 OFA family MFS transporter [Modestobacter sp. VKM Ac-2979]MCZ2840866.1 OFA family MFS transporter [Modestobacter sp. VKM Ac-2980]MCZ2848151.1 OFA family MFS transporter [Modestobacter sp. VKM Ac-2978]